MPVIGLHEPGDEGDSVWCSFKPVSEAQQESLESFIGERVEAAWQGTALHVKSLLPALLGS